MSVPVDPDGGVQVRFAEVPAVLQLARRLVGEAGTVVVVVCVALTTTFCVLVFEVPPVPVQTTEKVWVPTLRPADWKFEILIPVATGADAPDQLRLQEVALVDVQESVARGQVEAVQLTSAVSAF